MLPRGLLGRLSARSSRSTPRDLSYAALLARLSRSPGQFQIAQDFLKLASVRVPRSFGTDTKLEAAAARSGAVKSSTKSSVARAKEQPAKGKAPSKKKTTAKKSPAKTVKKAKAKPKAEGRPKKKELTPEESEKKLAREASKRHRELKQISLLREEPKKKKVSAWALFVKEELAGSGGSATSNLPAVYAKYSEVTPSERERLNQASIKFNAEREAVHRAWVESLSPGQVRDANRARMALRRLAIKAQSDGRPAPQKHLIKDERAPTRPVPPYLLFTNERLSSGDFSGIAAGERALLIRDEWKDLSSNDKQKYEDQFATAREKYIRDYEKLFGFPPHAAPQARKAAAVAT